MVVKKLRPRIPLPRTLRGRLIAGLVALLAVACACVGLVTYLALRGFLFDSLDQQLNVASQRYSACMQHQDGPPPQWSAGMPPPPSPQCGGRIPGQAAIWPGTMTNRMNPISAIPTVAKLIQ